jgi:hypothetical protein
MVNKQTNNNIFESFVAAFFILGIEIERQH